MTYRLYIDETGDHGYHRTNDEGQRYLGLIGLIVDLDRDGFALADAIEDLKRRFLLHSPDDPVVLHRRDIMRKTAAFSPLRDDDHRRAFNEALIGLIQEQRFRIVQVVLDKNEHLERYGRAAYHPYHYCLALLMERFCGYLHFRGATGDVVAESRGGQEDKQLKREYWRLYNEGTFYRRPEFFKHVLTSRQLKLKPKSANLAGLQLADLLVYPARQDVLAEFGRVPAPSGEFRDQLRAAMRGHYNRRAINDQLRGYGMVLV